MNFLGPVTARWGGGLPCEGVVAEKFVPSLESLFSLGFEGRNLGCPGIFAGMSRTLGGVQHVCAKKVRAHFSFLNKSGEERMHQIVVTVWCRLCPPPSFPARGIEPTLFPHQERIGVKHDAKRWPSTFSVTQRGAQQRGAQANASKSRQTQTNVDKRKQTQTRKRKQTQANASKREQTWTNANKRLRTPLYCGFYSPLCNSLKLGACLMVTSMHLEKFQRIAVGPTPPNPAEPPRTLT